MKYNNYSWNIKHFRETIQIPVKSKPRKQVNNLSSINPEQTHIQQIYISTKKKCTSSIANTRKRDWKICKKNVIERERLKDEWRARDWTNLCRKYLLERERTSEWARENEIVKKNQESESERDFMKSSLQFFFYIIFN